MKVLQHKQVRTGTFVYTYYSGGEVKDYSKYTVAYSKVLNHRL